MNSIIIILIYILGVIFSLYITYLVIRYAVRQGTKDALKQSEYYLEIIAKHYHDKNNKHL